MFIVKQKDENHPIGVQVSRVYNSRQAADDLQKFLAERAPEKTQYWVTEYSPRESA